MGTGRHFDVLVSKQLARLGLSPDVAPDVESWQKFLVRVSKHYKHVDENRRLLTRSIELSSEEMQGLQNRLIAERDRLRQLIAAVSHGLREFHEAVAVLPQSSAPDVKHITRTIRDAKAAFSSHLNELYDRDSDASSEDARTIRQQFLSLADQLAQLLGKTVQNAANERDLEVARVVQRLLVPSGEVIEREYVKLVGFFRPAGHCSGDWWSIYDLADGQVLTVIGDVTGHGIAPAIITGAAKASCDLTRLVAGEQLTCSELLATMNRCIYDAARQMFFMTCTASLFNPAKRTLTIANAGHNFPYLLRRRAGKPRLHHLVSHGNPLGSSPDSYYKPNIVDLEDGDVILWYTDGVTECENQQSQQFGEKRLRRVFSRVASSEPSHVRDAILDQVAEFCGDRVPSDDMTMIVACVGR